MKSPEFVKESQEIRENDYKREQNSSDNNFVPMNEEEGEENERLNSGDPKGTKDGRPMKPFVPVEEIPNQYDDEEAIIDGIDNKEEEQKKDKTKKEEKIKQQIIDTYNKIDGKKQIEEKTEINNRKKREKIGFLQNDQNVAHVGPEFYNEKKEKEMIPELVMSETDDTIVESEGFPYRKPMKEVFKDLFKYGWGPRRDMGRNTGVEKDNLKTMPDSKKERLSRSKLREIIDNGENFSNN